MTGQAASDSDLGLTTALALGPGALQRLQQKHALGRTFVVMA